MAKKRLKLKPKKQTIRKIRRNPWVIGAFLTFLVLLGLGLGALSMTFIPYDQHPTNLVWAADKTVNIPSDLVNFLDRRDDCKSYTGTNGPTGVGLWAVYQVSRGNFAKISYGCSTDLTTYIMAVKVGKSWQLLQPTQYFSTTGYLPKCSIIEKYQINKSIEPYCIIDNGSARANAVN